jgi:heme/copper-type cytochrome/quinol oxidase subunit 3
MMKIFTVLLLHASMLMTMARVAMQKQHARTTIASTRCS